MCCSTQCWFDTNVLIKLVTWLRDGNWTRLSANIIWSTKVDSMTLRLRSSKKSSFGRNIDRFIQRQSTDDQETVRPRQSALDQVSLMLTPLRDAHTWLQGSGENCLTIHWRSTSRIWACHREWRIYTWWARFGRIVIQKPRVSTIIWPPTPQRHNTYAGEETLADSRRTHLIYERWIG